MRAMKANSVLAATFLAAWTLTSLVTTANQESSFPDDATALATARAKENRNSSRAKRLKEALQSFQLHLEFVGEAAKPYFELTLTVAPVAKRTGPEVFFDRRIQITEAQAMRIIEYLASKDYFLRHAMELKPNGESPPLPWYNDNYALTISTKDFRLWEDWGWGRGLKERLALAGRSGGRCQGLHGSPVG